MNKILPLAILLALLPGHGHSQYVAKRVEKELAFEVATVKPCQPGTPEPPGHGPPMVHWVFPGGRFNAKAARFIYLMEWAYGIIPQQHSNVPSWMSDQLYDIEAKAEGNATEHEMKVMVRNLLADRFKLKLRLEPREMATLAVSLGKTAPKLFPAKEGETHSLRIVPQASSDPKTGSFHIAATRFTLEELNETFARQLGRVIVDETGIKGDLDFTLDFPFDEDRPDPLDPSNIIGAIRDQLGLTVKSQKGIADFFVIESAERVLPQ
jgi:uncharacterized protein (TIGR03435 family)